jgi:hypothetical protein
VIRGLAGDLPPTFTVPCVSSNPYSLYAKVASELDVRERITDHDTAFRADFRKIAQCLLEHAWRWLSAQTRVLIVRAVVESVDMSAQFFEFPLQVCVNALDCLC